MEQEAFARGVLTAGIALNGMGGVLLVTLAERSWRRLRLAAILGAVTGGMVFGVTTGNGVQGLRPVLAYLGFMGVAALLATIPAVLFSLLVSGIVAIFRTPPLDVLPFDGRFYRVLSPANWPTENGSARRPALSTVDLSRRWFVTIAAGTGGVVGAIVGTEEFFTALGKSLTPSGLFVAILLAVVSTVLIGPFQDFVLNKREVALEEPPKETEPQLVDLITGKARFRSWLRFGLIGALILCLELALNGLGNSLSSGNSLVVTLAMIGAITPAVVSYYWSAALQYGDRPMARRTAVASTTAGAALFYFAAITILVSGIATDFVGTFDAVMDHLGSLVFVGVLLAAVLGFVSTGLYGYLGGWVLDRFRGATGMIHLTLALFVGAAVQTTLVELLVLTGAITTGWDFWAVLSLITFPVFWAVGLVASGFPKLVMKPLPGSAEKRVTTD